MQVVIPDDYQKIIKSLTCFSILDSHQVDVYHDTFTTLEAQVEMFQNADTIVLTRERTTITEALVSRLPKLKLISQTGKISNHIDLEACNKYNIAVAEGVGSPIAPAELTWALIINASRKIPQAIEGMKKGLWQTNIGIALHGQTLGIWGYGKIGKKIAKFAEAFDMNVLVWGSDNSRKNAVADGYLAAPNKKTFFSTADIVSLHLRLVPETIHIVKASDLTLMKTEALFVNTSRAELVETDALLNALIKGRPGFAALDVFENEPILDANYNMLNMQNVVCTPHLGYVEQNGYELYFSKAFENIVEFSNGNPVNIVNPEVLKHHFNN